MAATRRIRTVLYGDQKIEAGELDLLHTPSLQRLYDLHQLGLTDRVFVDASHSRLQHVVGVLEQVDRITDAIITNLDRRPDRALAFRHGAAIKTISARSLANYVRTRRRAGRLMGLLHDLTHSPFGHTLEDEIELQPQKHDDPARQATAFYRVLVEYIGWLLIDTGVWEKRVEKRGASVALADGHAVKLAALFHDPILNVPPEDDSFVDYLAGLLVECIDSRSSIDPHTGAKSRAEVIQLVRDLRFAMRGLLWLDGLHSDRLDDLLSDASRERRVLPDGGYPFERLIDRILDLCGTPLVTDEAFMLQRDGFFLDIIGNTICADLLDYAKRDSHFAGLKLDYDVDRIVENFTVVSHKRHRKSDVKRKGYRALEPILRTAISIFSHKLRIDVPGELMNLLQVRFYVYQRVLFHPTKCIAGAMLGSAIQLMGWRELPAQYRTIGDAVFLHEVAAVARLVRRLLEEAGPGFVDKPLAEIAPVLLARLSKVPPSGPTVAAAELINCRLSHTVRAVLDDVAAASELLRRLSARRYHRPIFRLLPNASVRVLNLDAENIADAFLDSESRARAERQIERIARLPHGAITIHCPKGAGPKKIAEILMMREKDGQEDAFPLREISKVDQEIFEKHERAIVAVEEMYASMWRLVVSVAPPYQDRHEEINRIIGKVLFTRLTEDETVIRNSEAWGPETDLSKVLEVGNDENMESELKGTVRAGGSPTVTLVFPDGREEEVSERFVEIARLAVPKLEDADPRIAAFSESGRFAAEGPPVTIGEVVSSVISAARPLVQPGSNILKEARTSKVKQGDLLDQKGRDIGKERQSNEPG